MARVLPVIRELVGRLAVPISIDTRKAKVATAALNAGATIVNDVWDFVAIPTWPPSSPPIPAPGSSRCTTSGGPNTAISWRTSASAARESRHRREGRHPASQVIIDPGFGFAKTPAHNLELVRRLGELTGMGHAILIGPSRKSTTGMLIGEKDQAHRLEPSLALAVLSVQAGAHMVRVHDVAETVRALRAADAVVRGTPEALRDLPIPGPTG